jgi:hypothetical protein
MKKDHTNALIATMIIGLWISFILAIGYELGKIAAAIHFAIKFW